MSLTTVGVDATFKLSLSYDFNMPPGDDGLYRVLPLDYVVDHQDPGDLVVFGDDGCWAEGIVIGRERGFGGDLLLIERRGAVVCE